MNKPTPKTHRTTNGSTYNQARINQGSMPFGLIPILSDMHNQQANRGEIKLILIQLFSAV